jgi:chemotaxis protein methyltransferase CheR
VDLDLEVDLVLDVLHRRRGYDFRDYARASLTRRLRAAVERRKMAGLADLIAPLMRDDDFCERLIDEITTPFTEMFRDPAFFRAFRERVVPILQTHPRPRIWHAGCASGEEVYSLAILLSEAGVYDRCQVLATDMNRRALERAKEGIYPIDAARQFSENYVAAGGECSPGDYYHAAYGRIRMDQRLGRRVTWLHHDLVNDGGLGDIDVVLCRNVLIYFNRDLQNRVVGMLVDTLAPRGFLCLGSKESVRFLDAAARLEAVDADRRIFRRTHQS